MCIEYILEKVIVQFCILGNDFSKEEITNILKINPSNNTPPLYNTNWFISTKLDNYLYCEEAIYKIYNQLKEKVTELNYIKKRYSVQFIFQIILYFNKNEGIPGIYLDTEIVRFASSIGASFEFNNCSTKYLTKIKVDENGDIVEEKEVNYDEIIQDIEDPVAIEKAEVMVEFCILGDDFNPNDVTNILNIKPSQKYILGEEFEAKSGHILKRKETAWTIETQYEESLDVSIQLNSVYGRIQDKMNELKYIKDNYNTEFKFIIVIYFSSDGKRPLFSINKEIVHFIAQLGGVFDIDTYL